MYIFIDESGIHLQQGHSTVAVVFVEVNNLSKFEKEFLEVLKKLKISNFHWTDERWTTREVFVNAIVDLDFKFKVGIFKNPVHSDEMMETVFDHLISEESIKKVIIDAKKPRWYENRLKKILRSKNVSVKKLKTIKKDQSSLGIQLADCLAGLYRCNLDNPSNRIVIGLIRKIQKNQRVLGEFYLESKK